MSPVSKYVTSGKFKTRRTDIFVKVLSDENRKKKTRKIK